MNIDYLYWQYSGALPKHLVDDIVKLGNSKKKSFAVTDIQSLSDEDKKLTKKEKEKIKEKRNSKIAWLDDKWLYELLFPYLYNANESAKWNFDVTWGENFQYTEYGKGQYYHWHRDSFDVPFNNPNNLNFHNKIRKLSMTVQLSDPEDYTGGEFEIATNDFEPGKERKIIEISEIRPRGSILVFPSFLYHRIKPIKKGIRKSLVLWTVGRPFA